MQHFSEKKPQRMQPRQQQQQKQQRRRTSGTLRRLSARSASRSLRRGATTPLPAALPRRRSAATSSTARASRSGAAGAGRARAAAARSTGTARRHQTSDSRRRGTIQRTSRGGPGWWTCDASRSEPSVISWRRRRRRSGGVTTTRRGRCCGSAPLTASTRGVIPKLSTRRLIATRPRPDIIYFAYAIGIDVRSDFFILSVYRNYTEGYTSILNIWLARRENCDSSLEQAVRCALERDDLSACATSSSYRHIRRPEMMTRVYVTRLNRYGMWRSSPRDLERRRERSAARAAAAAAARRRRTSIPLAPWPIPGSAFAIECAAFGAQLMSDIDPPPPGG